MSVVKIGGKEFAAGLGLDEQAHLRGFLAFGRNDDGADFDQNQAGSVFAGSLHFKDGLGLEWQGWAEVCPLVEDLGITQFEGACDAANGAACAVFLQVHFAVEGGAGEGFAFEGADAFFDSVDDDF